MANKKTILITGGAGFIGSHLCKKYVSEGHKVICVDNLQTTNSLKNVEDLLGLSNFKFIQYDIVEKLKIKEKIDWIFNFACSGAPTSYQFDPVHTMKTSTIGVMNMLDLAQENKARIMQASTSEVYGDPLESPQKESYKGNVNTLGPRACYDEGKRAAETLFMDCYRECALDIRIIRIFNTFGPNMDYNDGRVVSNFIIKALKGDDLEIYGDGLQTRSFQYIDDLVDGIDKMMNQDSFIGPVNLGNPRELTIKEFAENIISLTNSSSKIIFSDPATDDPKQRKPDISLAKEKLDWESRVELEDGLRKTIEYFKQVEAPDSKILIWATTYYPDLGPAEEALYQLSQEIPQTEFHIITTRFKKDRFKVEKIGKDTIYRIGFGNRFDKFLLPFWGFWVANKLHKKYKYRFMWSIMASYGALGAFLLKIKDRGRIRFLLTFTEDELKKKKKSLFFPIYKLIFKNVDSVFVSNVNLEQKAKLFNKNITVTAIGSGRKNFLNQVRFRYAQLINEQDKKLSRFK